MPNLAKTIESDGNYSQPSIPSRFKPPKRKEKNVSKGFGSTDSRFNVNINEIPGPGSYNKIYESLLLKKTPSDSTKGMFASKVPNRPDEYRPDTPGPGTYNLPGIGHINDREVPTAAFLPNGQKGRVPFPEPNKIPGPLSYEINYDSKLSTYIPKSLRRQNSASFRSRSDRESFLQSLSDAPGPGLYTLSNASSEGHSTFWSKSTLPQREFLYDNKVPGPGQYFSDILNKPKRITNKSKNYFASLKKNKLSPSDSNLILGWIPSAPHTFGADKERFKDSFYGRLDLIAQIPGPGSYSPSIDINMASRCSSPFRSTVPNRESGLKPLENRPPGPLYYSPKSVDKKSFRYNLDCSWV